MISSPSIIATLLLAAASGLWLYQAKHRAEMLDAQIVRTLEQVAATRERIRLLRAEWALLNEPQRLNALARRHLGLRPLAASQFDTLRDLGVRLPLRLGSDAPLQPVTARAQRLGRQCRSGQLQEVQGLGQCH